MGIDLHTFRFLEELAAESRLGDVLTIGRQALDCDPAHLEAARPQGRDGTYCEWALRGLGAHLVESVDVSGYEAATHVADLGFPASLPRRYDMVVDAGSLEHVFDVATAFRNVIGFAALGGRIVHVLPVNNLSGHGFWQFSSDLLYSLYSDQNGFADTRVYYASSIDPAVRWLVPRPGAGTRTEIVSIEPVILLSVTTRRRGVERLSVQQPFYARAWDEGSHEALITTTRKRRFDLATLRRFALFRWARNAYTCVGLATGRSPFAMSARRFARHSTGRRGNRVS